MFRFPKKQKICSKNSIETLFASGSVISQKPFKLIWKFEENRDKVAVKSLIIVPKKRIKLAKDRNIIKRKVSEAYRLQKKEIELVLDHKNQHLNLALLYQYDKLLNYTVLEQKINLLLQRLINKI